MFADDFTVFPETHILTVEVNVLRVEGERFGEQLAAAGVTSSVTRYPGATHFASMLTKTWPTARRWHDDRLRILADLHARATVAS